MKVIAVLSRSDIMAKELAILISVPQNVADPCSDQVNRTQKSHFPN